MNNPHSTRKISNEKKEEVIESWRQDMTVKEIVELTGVAYTSVRRILNNYRTPLAKISDTPSTSTASMTLEGFVNMLHSLVTDYELTRSKLHELERNLERWKKIAGDLNSQLNQ
jgi:hypothetical protein